MLTKIKTKFLSKKGASDIVVVLIMIVIFAAVAFFVFNKIGGSTKKAGTNANNSIDNATTAATNFSND